MGGLTMPYIPCLDPDRPLTPSELADERRELYPDELPSEDRERFWEFVVPYFGLDESFQYTDDDIIEHLAAYDAED
jgi:hypothetical protein